MDSNGMEENGMDAIEWNGMDYMNCGKPPFFRRFVFLADERAMMEGTTTHTTTEIKVWRAYLLYFFCC